MLMNSTFRIVGSSREGQRVGTCFIVGRPIPNQKGRATYVLVTAAHVFNELVGGTATLVLRQRDIQGRWIENPWQIQIRDNNGQPKWVTNPNADVAAMYVPLPPNALPYFLPTDFLADDAKLTSFEVHPGDDLNVLGYPLGFGGPGGFPILRSGKIASYPLVPSKDNPFFLLDFRVFKGNSGGPVYLVSYNRSYGGGPNIGIVHMIMGLVSEEMNATEPVKSLYESGSKVYPLGIAKIVPASFIKETINMLPETPGEAASANPKGGPAK
jgi:S1-C subfamily serine protease